MISKKIYCFYVCVAALFSPSSIIAQVQVSEEPMHRPVLQNKYIRLLDVWLQPGDTTLFHIHSTPSLFVYLSGNTISSQIKGESWVKDQAVAGKSWYRSFSPDILVHRVTNLDSGAFHVNDIEILSSYKGSSLSRNSLPFTLLFENEKAFAWEIISPDFSRQTIRGRGPMVAIVVSGEGITFHDVNKNQSADIKPGKFLYIESGTAFYFDKEGTGEISMVIFEIK